MEIHASKKGPRMHARLCGELDHHSAEQARNMLDTMLHDITIRDLTLDLSGVTFMDSAGLGVILGRYRILSLRGGKLTVCVMSSAIDRIFRMSGLYAIVDRQ